MALIQFTKNHSDHSTDKGYQFEFFCDRCGTGFMTRLQTLDGRLCGQRPACRERPVWRSLWPCQRRRL